MILLLPLALASEVPGPWQGGDYVDLAVNGADVHATWLVGKDLYYSQLPAPAVRVASGVESGDGGQIRPQLVLAGAEPHVLFTTTDGLFRAELADGWQPKRVSPEGAKGPFLADLAAGPGGVHVVGLSRADGATQVFVDGKVVFTGGEDGVCMCCKPAVTAVGPDWWVDFRDADGLLREVHSLRSTDGQTWADAGLSTKGGWSPGGCPADGPDRSQSALLVSDARSGRRVIYSVDHTGERALPSADPAAQMVQPRALPDGSLAAWVEAVAGESRLVVRDGPGTPTVVVKRAGRLEPGDPVAVGSEVWLPWQGEHAQVERWESQAPPGF